MLDGASYTGPTRFQVALCEEQMSPLEIAFTCALIEECLQKLEIIRCYYPNIVVKYDFLDVYER